MQKLGFSEKIAYAIGDMANGLAVSSCAFWYLIYLTDIVQISPAIAGVILMTGRIWEAIANPIMGTISDNTNSRWGKRRPYILSFSVFFAFFYFALWTIPDFDSKLITNIYIFALIIIFNTCFTAVFVPYASLTASLTSDYNERTSLTGYRMTFSQIAFLLGATLPSFFVSWTISENGRRILDQYGINNLFGNWSGTARQSYAIMAAIFSILIIVSLWICFFGTKEREFSIERKVQKKKFSIYAPILDTIKEIKECMPFRISASMTLLTNIVATFVGVNIPYWLQYVVGMKSQEHFILGTLFISAIISIPLWVIVSKKFGKAETYRISMSGYAMVLFILPFISGKEIIYVYGISILAGLFYAAGLILPWAIVPDIVEFDQLQNGTRREGLFYGGTAFVYKMATAFAVFISASYLGLLGYVPNAPQSETVIVGLKLIMGPVPASILIAAIFVSKLYPITQSKHKEILQKLSVKSNIISP